MGKAIIAELAHSSAEERAEVRGKVDELAGDAWQSGKLSDGDEQALEAALAAYEKSPGAGSSWEQVKARAQGRLRA